MHSKLIAGSMVAMASTMVSGVKYAGANIAGFDFGCGTDGTCTVSGVSPPLGGSGQGDGPGQIQHFASVDKFNIFRLPVGWQYLVNNQVGGPLDESNFANYDKLVQACLKVNARCIIDIHNYARWNGQIIGSGGPSADQFADLWSQLATKYADKPNVVMGLMNEPHDMPDIGAWASGPVQSAVNAIRKAGAKKQIILLPGDGYTGASTFVSGGSGAALAKVTDPAGGTDKLVFDIHQYFDQDNSGTNADCVDKTSIFSALGDWLKSQNRQAMISETGGGGSSSSCLQYVCEALDTVNKYQDNFLGWSAWAAGSFQDSYVLSLLSSGTDDVPLVTKCFAAKFNGQGGGAPVSPGGNSTTTTPSTGGLGTGTSPGSASGTGTAGSGTSSSPSAPPSNTPASGSTSSGGTTPPGQGSGSGSGKGTCKRRKNKKVRKATTPADVELTAGVNHPN